MLVLSPFLEGFSHHAEPVTQFTRKYVKFEWGPEQRTSFLKLKALLVSNKVMAVPRPNEPYLLYTDALDYAVVAILVQRMKQVLNGLFSMFLTHYLSRNAVGVFWRERLLV